MGVGGGVSPTPRPHVYPRERPGTHFTGDWVGPRAGLDGRKNSSVPGFDPVAQSLYRLSYRAQLCAINISLFSLSAAECGLIRQLDVFAPFTLAWTGFFPLTFWPLPSHTTCMTFQSLNQIHLQKLMS